MQETLSGDDRVVAKKLFINDVVQDAVIASTLFAQGFPIIQDGLGLLFSENPLYSSAGISFIAVGIFPLNTGVTSLERMGSTLRSYLQNPEDHLVERFHKYIASQNPTTIYIRPMLNGKRAG